MTKEEIIEMVMQIGGCDRPEDDSPALKMFVTFATLIADHEREAFTAHAITSAEKAIDVAIKLEREECAVIAEEWFCGCGRGNCPEGDLRAQDIAATIRARGQE